MWILNLTRKVYVTIVLNLTNIIDKYQNFTMGRGKKERSIKNKIKVPHIWQQSPREVNNLVDRRFYFRHTSIMFIISLIANDKFTNPFRRTILELLWVNVIIFIKYFLL